MITKYELNQQYSKESNMKKGMSKLLSALLIATLVFTSAGVAFADTGGSEASGAIKVFTREETIFTVGKRV